MKKIFLFFASMVLVIHSFCQQSNHSLTREDYLKKAKNQKTVGSILIGTGLVAGSVGLIVGLKGFSKGLDWTHPDRGKSGMDAGSAFAIAGGVLFVAGIPFMIESGKNKKKALSAGIVIEKMPLNSNVTNRICQSYPAITLRLDLGKSK